MSKVQLQRSALGEQPLPLPSTGNQREMQVI